SCIACRCGGRWWLAGALVGPPRCGRLRRWSPDSGPGARSATRVVDCRACRTPSCALLPSQISSAPVPHAVLPARVRRLPSPEALTPTLSQGERGRMRLSPDPLPGGAGEEAAPPPPPPPGGGGG